MTHPFIFASSRVYYISNGRLRRVKWTNYMFLSIFCVCLSRCNCFASKVLKENGTTTVYSESHKYLVNVFILTIFLFFFTVW
jgi:hypothetical protein